MTRFGNQFWLVDFAVGNKRANAPEDVVRGEVEFPAPGPTNIGVESIDWNQWSDSHPSWALWFMSLKWLDRLLLTADRQHLAAPDSEYARHALLVAHSWIAWDGPRDIDAELTPWHPHPSALRLTTLLGLAQIYPDDRELSVSIDRHVEHLLADEHFDGHWNHGLVQSLALTGAGLQLARQGVVDVAWSRVHGCLAAMIDDEGAINEQAPGYAGFILALTKVAIRVGSQGSLPGVDRFRSRLELLERFILNSLEPGGTFVQLGDTHRLEEARVTRPGADGKPTRQAERGLAIYKQGYAYGRLRTHGALIDSFFSLRFGPGRIIHGHNDHLSATWVHAGRDVIVDSGHMDYKRGPYRSYLQSVEAHSTPRVEGVRHQWDAPTRLVSHDDESPRRMYVAAEDEAYAGVTRRRGVMLTDDGLFVVVDNVSSDQRRSYRFPWHLAGDVEVLRLDETCGLLRSEAIDIAVYVFRFGDGVTAESSRYFRGSEIPIRGWRSTGLSSRQPIPVVEFGCAGTDVSVVTVFAAGGSGREKVTITDGEAGGRRFTLRADGIERSFSVLLDGSIQGG